MKKFCFLIILSALFAMQSSAISMRMYSCEGDGFDIALEHFSADEEFDLTIERHGRELDLSGMSFQLVNNVVSVSAENTQGTFAFSVQVPTNTNVEANERGMIDYGEIVPTVLSLTKNDKIESYNVECRVYDLTEEFFDAIFDSFPI